MKTLSNLVKSSILAAGTLAFVYSSYAQGTIDSSNMKIDTTEIDVGAITINSGERYQDKSNYTINDIEPVGSVSQKTFTIGIDVDTIDLGGLSIRQNQPHYTISNLGLLSNSLADDIQYGESLFNTGISPLEGKAILFEQDSIIGIDGSMNFKYNDSVSSVPEPSTLALGSIALALAYSIRRKR